jgi:hypothetical protein|nr:MAG: hypothetical protein [Bacteriophage sp.]UVX76517.1 MAG: hypothetical protein [Bacteriophage sp.]UWI25466.1 MAG: hypothetical protein [Bacteriophage sp.]DAV56212.1 MAG TPA: hypothetical protein [Caudoviricetes sp.]
MKIKIILTLIAIIASCLMCNRIQYLTEENNRLSNNQETLLTENEHYKIRDSLNVSKTNQLELKLSELKKYKSEYTQLVKDLNIKNSQLEQIISVNAETITNLKAMLRDSIRLDTVSNIIDTLKCFEYKSKYTDVSGCINKDIIDMQIRNRESLKAIESKKKKKFLFFKLPIWLFGYKSKQLDIVSLNPNTTIEYIEYISVTK